MSTTTTLPPTTQKTCPPSDYIDKFISLLSRSFLSTPLTTAFISEIDNVPPAKPTPLGIPNTAGMARHGAPLKGKYLVIPDSGPRSWDQPAAPSQSSGGPSEDPYPGDFNKNTDYGTRPFYHLALLPRDPDVEAEKQDAAMKACLQPFLERRGRGDCRCGRRPRHRI